MLTFNEIKKKENLARSHIVYHCLLSSHYLFCWKLFNLIVNGRIKSKCICHSINYFVLLFVIFMFSLQIFMAAKKVFCAAIAILFLAAVFIQQTEAGKMKKIIIASVIANSLKPRFIPLPIPIPFKLKINKGEKIVPYP